HNQSLVALVVYESGSCLDAEGPVYRTEVVTYFLQSTLNVCDHLIREQITIGVNGPVVVVVAVIGIVSPSWIPIAGVEEIISAGDKNNGIAMLLPPIAIVPFMPIATKGVGIAKTILSRLPLQLLLVRPHLAVRQITRCWFHTVIFSDALCLRRFQAFRNPLPRHSGRWL